MKQVASAFQVFIMDVIDGFIVFFLALGASLLYVWVGLGVRLSRPWFFLEGYLDVALEHPQIIIYFLVGALVFTFIYYVSSFFLLQNTVGGKIARVRIAAFDGVGNFSLLKCLVRAAGSFCSVVFSLMIIPLHAWWLEPQHRGLGDLWARTLVIKKQ